MDGGKYEIMLLLAVLSVILVYMSVLGIKTVGPTGYVVHEIPAPSMGIYDFLSTVKNYPNKYVILIGENPEEYENELALSIREGFQVRIAHETELDADSNLILIGNPSTNSKLDQLLSRPYSKDEVMLLMSGNNLLVVINDEEQALRTADIIRHFNDQKEKLSPDIAVFSFGHINAYYAFVVILVIVALLFWLEYHRKKNIALVRELKTEHKLEALERYIDKYTREGHPIEQIRLWLIDYGYEQRLVDNAIRLSKNAGANLPGQLA